MLVGVPVGEQVHAGGDDERDQRAALAADQIADAHEQGGQARQQHGGTQVVHRPSPRGRRRAARRKMGMGRGFKHHVAAGGGLTGTPIRRISRPWLSPTQGPAIRSHAGREAASGRRRTRALAEAAERRAERRAAGGGTSRRRSAAPVPIQPATATGKTRASPRISEPIGRNRRRNRTAILCDCSLPQIALALGRRLGICLGQCSLDARLCPRPGLARSSMLALVSFIVGTRHRHRHLGR